MKRRICSVLLILALLCSLLPTGTILAARSTPFVDVAEDAWYCEAVKYCAQNGIFKGVDDTHFNPAKTMNRAMFVTVLWRIAGEPKPEVPQPYIDVDRDSWYEQAVLWASGLGITTGVDATHFNPYGAVTREQVTTFLHRYVGKRHTDTSEIDRFPDKANVHIYATTHLAWAIKEGLIAGTSQDGRILLDPRGTATRAQVATILMRFVQSGKSEVKIPEGAETFNGHSYYVFDIDSIADWNTMEAYCEMHGGHLATITDAEEDVFVYNYLLRSGYQRALFGLTDQKQEGVWEWVTGERLDYTNWNPGEPNGETEAEDYAEYANYANGTWNDNSYTAMTVHAFICEWDSKAGDEPDKPDAVEKSAQAVFLYNNGTDEVYQQQTVEAGEKLTCPETDPVREEYAFTGWYLEPAGITEYDFNTELTGDLILYAGWGAPDGSEELYAVSDDQWETVYSITGIKMSEDRSEVSVTLNTNSVSMLEVKFFADETSQDWTQQNMEQNLEQTPIETVTGVTPEYGELISVSLPVMSMLPQYYLIQARLLDVDAEGNPVERCAAFVCTDYTQLHEQFERQTIEDFPEDRVVNFDDEPTTNFGVLTQDVTQIETSQDENILAVEDVEVEGEIVPKHVYTFTNPSVTVQQLQVGDVVDIVGTTYLFKVGKKTEDNRSVILEPDQTATLTDFYECLKIDMCPQETSTAMQPRIDIVDVDRNPSVTEAWSFNYEPYDWLEIKGGITATIGLQIKMEYNLHLFGEDHFVCELIGHRKFQVNGEISAQKQSNKETAYILEPKRVEIPTPIKGLDVYAEVSLPIEWSVSGNIIFNLLNEEKSGFVYHSYDGLQKVNEKDANVGFIAKAAASVKTGPDVELGITFLSGVLDAGLNVQCGIEASCTASAGDDNFLDTPPEKHECYSCLSGTTNWFIEGDANVRYDISKKLNGTLVNQRLFEFTGPVPIPGAEDGEFFISIENSADSPYHGQLKFGGGKCANIAYRTQIKVEQDGAELMGLPVELQRHGVAQPLTGKTPYTAYLYNGTYTAKTQDNQKPLEKTIFVAGKAQDVTISQTTCNGVLRGQVCDSDKKPIQSALVRVYAGNLLIAERQTDASGRFSVSVPGGKTLVRVTKSGFLDYSAYATVENNKATELGTVVLRNGFGMGSISGMVKDAANGRPLQDVTLQLYRNWNSTEKTDLAEEFRTDAVGAYQYGRSLLLGWGILACGYYTLVASKEGYEPKQINIIVERGNNEIPEIFLEEQISADAIWHDFLASGRYKSLSGWERCDYVPTDYAILDIDGDDWEELILYTSTDSGSFGWGLHSVLRCDKATGEIYEVQIEDPWGEEGYETVVEEFGGVKYSERYHAIAYATINMGVMWGGYDDYFVLSDGKMNYDFSVGCVNHGWWDDEQESVEYFIDRDGISENISESEYLEYVNERKRIEFLPISGI